MEKMKINYEETCKECGHIGILILECDECNCLDICAGKIEKFCFKCGKQHCEPTYLKIIKKHILLLIISILSIQSISAQNHLNEVISEEDSVLIAIEVKNQYLSFLQLEEELEARKYDWLNYLPTPGYSRLFGPELRYNFTQIYSVLRDRNSRKLRRKELSVLAIENAEKEKEEYLLLLEEKNNFEAGIELRKDNLSLEKRLFELDQERYKNNEISISELISKEITYSAKLIAFRELQLKLKEFERKVNYFTKIKKRFQSDVQ
jgi:hypothetical protein